MSIEKDGRVEERVEDVRVQSSCRETARHPASERLITSPPSLLLLLLLYPSLLRRDTRLSPSPSPFCADAPTAREKRR